MDSGHEIENYEDAVEASPGDVSGAHDSVLFGDVRCCSVLFGAVRCCSVMFGADLVPTCWIYNPLDYPLGSGSMGL